MRGTQEGEKHCLYPRRFIPAHAGNTREGRAMRYGTPAHPRACGEHGPDAIQPPLQIGSSPRMRGTLWAAECGSGIRRFIPAHAGNTCGSACNTPTPPVHPRACGEHRSTPQLASPSTGSSPRMRGTRLHGGSEVVGRRFIPAHAGNTVVR